MARVPGTPLKTEQTPIVLVAHSMGGLVAKKAGGDYPGMTCFEQRADDV